MKGRIITLVLILGAALLLGACESNTPPGANIDPDYPISMGCC